MKKTAEVSALAAIIIVLASAILIGGVVYKLAIEGKALSDIEKCRLSILVAVTTKSVPSPPSENVPVPKRGTPYVPIKCTRGKLGDVVVKKDDIVENNIINQDKFHKIIADAMAECWWMVGEGKLDPFSNWQDKGKSYCLMCKKITFDDELKEFIGNHLDTIRQNPSQQEFKKYIPTGVVPYLVNTNMPDKDITYWEYLRPKETPPTSQEITWILPETQIIVQMYKLNEKSKWAVAGIIAGTVAAIIATILLAPIAVPTWLASISLGTITVGTAITLAASAGVGIGGLYVTGAYTFSECPDCNAIGGILLIPPTQDLTMEVPICLKEDSACTQESDYDKKPLCSLLVN